MVIFIVWIVLIHLEQKTNLICIKAYVEIKIFVMLECLDTKILKFNQYFKSEKRSFTIYADLKSLIEYIDGCKNNPEKSSTTNEHIPSRCLISRILSIKENKIQR